MLTCIPVFFLDIGIDRGRDLADTNPDREVRVGVRRNPDAQIESVLRKKVNKDVCIHVNLYCVNL